MKPGAPDGEAFKAREKVLGVERVRREQRNKIGMGSVGI